MSGLVRVAGFAEIRDEIQHRLGDAHVLSAVVLREMRLSHHQWQSENVGQIFAANAAQPLYVFLLLCIVDV